MIISRKRASSTHTRRRWSNKRRSKLPRTHWIRELDRRSQLSVSRINAACREMDAAYERIERLDEVMRKVLVFLEVAIAQLTSNSEKSS